MRVLLVDIALIAASFFFAGYPTLFLDPSLFFIEEGGALLLAPIVLSMVLAMYFADLYGRKPPASRILLAQQLCFAGGVALLSQAFIAYLNADWILPKLLTFAGVAISLAAIFAWRLILAVIVSRMAGARAVLILGTGETVQRIARHIEKILSSITGLQGASRATRPTPLGPSSGQSRTSGRPRSRSSRL